jgi:hypothetical protein
MALKPSITVWAVFFFYNKHLKSEKPGDESDSRALVRRIPFFLKLSTVNPRIYKINVHIVFV